MAVFIGTFENKVDGKGRVSVPASFRQALTKDGNSGFVAFPSHRVNAIEACGMDFVERLNASITTLDFFSEDQDDLASILFGDCTPITIDSDGRFVLSQDLAEAANITDRAAFVGKGPIFQIWEPSALAASKAAARARARERGLTLSLEPKPAGGQ